MPAEILRNSNDPLGILTVTSNSHVFVGCPTKGGSVEAVLKGRQLHITVNPIEEQLAKEVFLQNVGSLVGDFQFSSNQYFKKYSQVVDLQTDG